MRTVILVCALATCAFAFAAAEGAATAPPILVVDDDGAQCAKADFATIQAAVDAAPENGLVRVCPGLYAEQVSVAASLTIRGDAETVEAVDCFAPTRPTADPNTQAIVVAPSGATAGAPAVVFDLQADNIELQGFVLPGRTGSTSGVRTSSAHSGYRIHHNLIMATTVAAYFRSSGVYPSSFDHNCLRENSLGVINHYLPLSNARIHHNATFRTAAVAFEQTSNCPEFLETGVSLSCAASRVGTDHVVYDHNTSIGDAVGNSGVYWFASSTSTTAFENTVIPAGRRAMMLFGANYDLHIIDNHLEVPQVGLARQSTPAAPPNFRVLIRGNTITGAPGNDPSVPTAGIGMGVDGLKNSWILDNVISGLAAGEGIALLASNTDNLVRGNKITNNDKDGIRVAAGATGNTFEANEILGNGRILGFVDARDDAREFNVWRGNVCLTDFPAGTICGIG